jgi:8-oxo-dGTP diphosphatase
MDAVLQNRRSSDLYRDRVTLYLVRHGSAGSRNEADPFDLERRLDEVGHRQAELLVELLATTVVSEIRSSPAPRCLETVAPLAAARGLEVRPEDALLEGTPVEESWAIVEALAVAGTDAVLCSHGDVIPDLIRRAQARGMEVPGRAGCSKGSVWALHWVDGSFARGDYTPLKA